MQPAIITKKFTLAGYETAVDLSRDFADEIGGLRAKLRQNADRVGWIASGRPAGFWTGNPNVDYQDRRNHSKRVYFFGVEAARADAVPSDFIVRAFPECAFAVFREPRRGTAPKWQWLETSGYRFNSDAIPGDFEVFDDWEHTDADCPCDIWVPVASKEE